MATQDLIDRALACETNLKAINVAKILRKDLGEASFESVISPLLDEINYKTSIVSKVVSFVGNSTATSGIAYLEAINVQLSMLVNYSTQEYVASGVDRIAAITANLEALRDIWANFYTTYQERFPQKPEKEVASETAAAILQSYEQSKSKVAELDNLVNEVTQLKFATQKTAAGVSINEAQTQFSNAEKQILFKIKLSAALVCAFTIWFFIQAYCFMDEAGKLLDIWTWKIAYHASIRAVILGAIGALSTFSLSLLRAYLHLFELNGHKQRVANSTESFLAAAQSPEQRDNILAKLVDAVVSFGDSGLLKASTPEISKPTNISLDVSSKI